LSLEIGSKRTLKLNDIFFIMQPEASLDSASLSVYVVVAESAGAVGSLKRK